MKIDFSSYISYLYTSSSSSRSFSIQRRLFYYSRKRFFALKPDNLVCYIHKLIGFLLLLAANTQLKKRKRETFALFFDRHSCKEYLNWIDFHVAKNFSVGISRKLTHSKMFRNGHSQKWIMRNSFWKIYLRCLKWIRSDFNHE